MARRNAKGRRQEIDLEAEALEPSNEETPMSSSSSGSSSEDGEQPQVLTKDQRPKQDKADRYYAQGEANAQYR